MRPHRKTWIGLLLGISIAAGVVVAWRSRETTSAPGEGLNVVWISIDTLRADHLGCYGHPEQATPNIDRLAAEGTLFEQCTSSCPITLPSHSSMLTATHPFVHGARHNGEFHLHEDNVTLAEVLHGAGYATLAEVAAFVLNREFGMNQGFEVYNDVPPAEKAGTVSERTAEDICAGATDLLQNHTDRPFFLFVHFYDPHMTYEPPPRFAARYASPYLGEVAYADEQVGRLLEELRRLDLEDNTLVILTSDHGEGLGQHGEQTHTAFVYDTTLSVPLILRCPGRIPAGRRVAAQVRLVDIAPTVLAFLGQQPLADAQGVDLLPLIDARREDLHLPAYAESMSPRYNWGFAPLWALRVDGWKYIHAPQPQLYDVREDPGEEQNLAARQPERVAGMSETLRQIIAEAPVVVGTGAGQRQTSAEDLARLESLGYVGTGAHTAEVADTDELALLDAGGRDPHDHAEQIELTERAMSWMNRGEFRKGEEALARLLRQSEPDAEFHWAHRAMAFALAWRGAHQEAVEHYRRALAFRPDDARTLARYAASLTELGRTEEALAAFEQALRGGPVFAQMHAGYGVALYHAGRLEEASAALRRALEMEPQDAENWARLARVLLAAGRVSEAISELERGLERTERNVELTAVLSDVRKRTRGEQEARRRLEELVALKPDQPGPLVELANLHLQRGRTGQAERHLEQALRVDPRYAPAWHALAFLHLRQGRQGEAVQAFESALAGDPEDTAVANDLAWLRATSSDPGVRDGAEALRLARETLGKTGAAKPNVLDTLAAALAELGRFEEAVEAADRAIQAARQAGDDELARRLEDRRESYRRGVPWRMTP